MTDLASAFAGLLTYHVATPACPLPLAAPGITWIFAANGVFKRGVDRQLDALVCVKRWPAGDIPGLASLMPYARWAAWPGRLPGALLDPLLENAVNAASDDGAVLRPIEKHYCFVRTPSGIKLIAPVQQGTAGRVVYEPLPGTLADIHSHHGMAAFFSSTDDADDTGLSVSGVVGRIFEDPEILLRINVFGHRQQIPALSIFNSLGPFRAKEWRYARADD